MVVAVFPLGKVGRLLGETIFIEYCLSKKYNDHGIGRS